MADLGVLDIFRCNDGLFGGREDEMDEMAKEDVLTWLRRI